MSTHAAPSARRILLVDADAFFVGVARLVDPDGAGRAPLLIVGGRPGGRGVVCSASYETRAFGVRSAMPISRALRLCPGALCVPVPAECRAMSQAIRAELERWTPVVEGASIDEWYLDLSGTEQLYGHETLADTATRMRRAVLAATGLGVSIGGGPSKLVAKLAVELAKPSRSGRGVHIVAPEAVTAFLDSLPLSAIPGVGPQAQERLLRYGLRDVKEARAAGPEALVRMLGPRGGAWLDARIRGEDLRPVEARALRKQISHERTFSRDIADDEALAARVAALAARVASDLRASGLRCRTVTVKARDRRFRTRTASVTLSAPVESDQAIRRTARRLFTELRGKLPGPLRLLGVAIGGFEDEAPRAGQLGLFVEPAQRPEVESERDRQLSRALDQVRARFGHGSLQQGDPSD